MMIKYATWLQFPGVQILTAVLSEPKILTSKHHHSDLRSRMSETVRFD
eukprot:SAG31_NODE_1347_length_8693_cov_32.744938_8_plen_48_part_00